PGTVLRGLPASPGLALGPARCLRPAEPEAPPARVDDPAAELERLRAAMDRVAAEVRSLRDRVAAAGRPREAEIFDAHLLLLSDEALLEPARRAAAAGANPVRAWLDACEDAARAWEAVDDEYLRARAWDVRGIARQVLDALAGAPPPAIRGEGVVVAADLTPAETVRLDRALVRGIATARGGPTSHTAILARSLGIPAVVGVGPALLGIAEGTPVALDGDRGEVHVDPPPEVAEGFEARVRERAEAERRARAAARAPAATLDGVGIEVAANVGHPDEAAVAVGFGADAVGLFRTEFLFMERDRMPSEEEQEAAYRAAAEALGGRPLTIRTLDVGADKPLPYLRLAPEANPFLGLRGIRLALAEPEVLRAQLRAILRVAADHPVRVMFPMVATVRELREARRILEEERARLGGPSLEVGAMIEVPAAALRAGALAALVEFLSIGTNDLTQYALAAERGNERVAGLADPLHPAVLALVRATVEGAAGHGRWVGVCGEAAGEEAAVPLLVGLGVRELSVAPPRIPAVKEAVRRTRAAAARELALRALELAEADEVRRLVAEGFEARVRERAEAERR
ncbi:MAG TPA: phosphoenolpyruvate--protein phosphotransferase, partial [Actinomycetota bacterium]|nr:phosphoenolpyruvate--protein phosphotransferase [Actinomycetota bacterium]